VTRRVPLIAKVECRSEGSPEQRPVALWIGGVRLEVDEILDDSVIGAADAGGLSGRRLRVRLEDRCELVLERVLPEGEWRVYRM